MAKSQIERDYGLSDAEIDQEVSAILGVVQEADGLKKL